MNVFSTSVTYKGGGGGGEGTSPPPPPTASFKRGRVFTLQDCTFSWICSSAVVPGQISLSTCRVKFHPDSDKLTKQWSGNKCSDVPTKIQISSYGMDHPDWPGKQWWTECQACHCTCLTARFSQIVKPFESLFLLYFVFKGILSFSKSTL